MSTTPAFVLTYNSLVSSVEQYLERNDQATINQIPTFIAMCEFEIAQEIKTLGQLTVSQSTLNAGSNVLAKPGLWRKTVSMNVVDPTTGYKTPVLLRKYEYCIAYNTTGTLTGDPAFYSDYDYYNWYVTPTPTANTTFEVLYYQRIPPLASDNQSNWLTNYAPNAMLYGTLLQAMLFLKDDQRTIFQQKYTEAIAALKAEDISRVADRQAIAIDS
jgi:hypothetical protein